MFRKIILIFLILGLTSLNVYAEEIGNTVSENEYPKADAVLPNTKEKEADFVIEGSVEKNIDMTLERCIELALGNNPRHFMIFWLQMHV